MPAPAQRYAAIAIVLHWAIAFSIALLIPLGWWMSEQAEDGVVSDALFQAYQLHKSIGLTVLALSLTQLGWRIAHPPPPLPDHMPAWERIGAHAAHWGLYVLMLALPLTGWLYVSAGWSEHDDAPLHVTTRWFGLFVVPDLFGLPNTGADVREEVADAAMDAHEVLAWGAIILAGLHAAAALKHHVINRDNVLTLMVPGLRQLGGGEPAPKNPLRLAILGSGFALTFAGLAAALFALANLGPGPQAQSQIEIAAPAETMEEEWIVDPNAPPAWRVDPRASSIGFAFAYDDGQTATRFVGRFTRWRADIRFDPNDLAASRATVTIETASATDGVAMHDRALPGPDWFNAEAHPTATFRASEFRHLGGDAYEARGELIIRSQTRDFTLPFTLVITGDRAVMTSSSQLDRHDFDIGKSSDADDMISRDIDLAIRVEAVRRP